MYYVYILKSLNYAKTYTGITDNIDHRLREHNSGKSKFTSRFIPWDLLYKEKVDSYYLARKREKYFKSGAGRSFIKNLLK